MKKRLLAAALLFAVLISAVFASCSSASSGAAAPKTETASAAARDGTGMAVKSEKATAKPAASQPAAPAGQRKIVKNANLTVETTQYEKSASDFEALVPRYGGYIASSSVQGTSSGGAGGNRTATYTVRIPAEKLEQFLGEAGGIGNVVEKGISGDDVTQSYIDADTKLKTLQTEQNRILELMSKATKIDDVLSIEQRLTDVQNEIAQITAQLKNWDSLVSLSTVTVTLSEVETISNPESRGLGYQVGSVFTASLHALVTTGRYLLIGLIAILPFAVIILAVLAVVWWIRRKKKKAG